MIILIVSQRPSNSAAATGAARRITSGEFLPFRLWRRSDGDGDGDVVGDGVLLFFIIFVFCF